MHGWYFDSALKRMFEGQISDSVVRPHLDAGGGDRLPASEEPFLVGNTPYYLSSPYSAGVPHETKSFFSARTTFLKDNPFPHDPVHKLKLLRMSAATAPCTVSTY